MNYMQAKQIATQLTGRTPRWCDVRDEAGDFPPAPTANAMNDCIAIKSNFGPEVTSINYWVDEKPVSAYAEAICYF